MTRVPELRKEAALRRRLAGTPAGRDPLLDRELLALADQLEEQADLFEDLIRQPKGFPTDSYG